MRETSLWKFWAWTSRHLAHVHNSLRSLFNCHVNKLSFTRSKEREFRAQKCEYFIPVGPSRTAQWTCEQTSPPWKMRENMVMKCHSSAAFTTEQLTWHLMVAAGKISPWPRSTEKFSRAQFILTYKTSKCSVQPQNLSVMPCMVDICLFAH